MCSGNNNGLQGLNEMVKDRREAELGERTGGQCASPDSLDVSSVWGGWGGENTVAL